MLPQSFYILEAILFGLAVGSFSNVCIYRIPKEITIGGRSYCPNCKKKISWFENIPLLSYIFLGGRCLQCRRKISLQYPLIEGLVTVLSVWTLQRAQFDLVTYLIWFLLFVCPLMIVSVIDIHHRIIPDVISLPGIIIGILVSLYFLRPAWVYALKFSFFGILAGGGTLYVLGLLYYWIRKKEGMGGGDVKLAAMLGAFLGWKAIVFVFLFSSILALIYAVIVQFILQKKEEQIIPYGPFLAAASLLYYYYGFEIVSYYFQCIGLPIGAPDL